MIIDGAGLIPKSGAAEHAGSTSSSGAADNRKHVARPGEETRFSADSAKVQELKARLTEYPEIRQEKVQALQKAVQAGRYQVSDAQLAEAISAEMLTPATLR